MLILSLLAFGMDYAVMGFAPTLSWLFIGPRDRGRRGRGPHHGQCLRGRHQSAGKTGAELWPDWRGVWRGVYPRSGAGWAAWQLWPAAPFFAAAALAAINMVYGYFVLPETLPVEARRPFTWRRANTLGTVLQLRRYPAVMGHGRALFLWQLATRCCPTLGLLHQAKVRMVRGAIGMSLAFAGVTMAVVQGGLTRVLIPQDGRALGGTHRPDGRSDGVPGLRAVVRDWMIYVCIVFASLAGLAQPSMNGLMSRDLPPAPRGSCKEACPAFTG